MDNYATRIQKKEGTGAFPDQRLDRTTPTKLLKRGSFVIRQ